MDTRVRLFTLIDYEEFYSKIVFNGGVLDLIRNIPGSTLLNYIAGFNLLLYQNEQNEISGEVQHAIVYSLIGKGQKEIVARFVEVVKHLEGIGQHPIFGWRYSNLLMYGQIFRRFNNQRSRKLSANEGEKLFRTYLMINATANSQIKLEEAKIASADADKTVYQLMMTHFIYQRDYMSNSDFSNQLVRGIRLFGYLENHPIYGAHVKSYYQSLGVRNYAEIAKTLLVLFLKLGIDKETEQRSQLVDLKEEIKLGFVNTTYLGSLCINQYIKAYKEDKSFTELRNRFLYHLHQDQYLLLDISFLLDHFYKAQVFGFSKHLVECGVKNSFLSDKAKELMEEIHLPKVLTDCFSGFFGVFGASCSNSSKDELCDAYLRQGNKIALIEFKDVMLSADAKTSAVEEQLFGELDKKFLKNQKSKPKGITQLARAVVDLENHGANFDAEFSPTGHEIYPIIVYTDGAFGIEGLNQAYSKKFGELVRDQTFLRVTVRLPTFINLSTFELWQEMFSTGKLDFFDLLDKYHEHIDKENYEATTFEVFVKSFMNGNNIPINQSHAFREVLSNLFAPESFGG